MLARVHTQTQASVAVDQILALAAVQAHAWQAVVNVVLAVVALEPAHARAVVLDAELVACRVILAAVAVRLTRPLVTLAVRALKSWSNVKLIKYIFLH
jgi:hypothetical protein